MTNKKRKVKTLHVLCDSTSTFGQVSRSGLVAGRDFMPTESLFLRITFCSDVAMLRTCCEVVAEILCIFPAIDAGCSDVAELSGG